MDKKICQSCGMPIESDDQLGTNADGSISLDYCKYCFDNGKFIDNVSMKEYIEMCSKYGEQAGMTNEQMKKHCQQLFPTLKRWKKEENNNKFRWANIAIVLYNMISAFVDAAKGYIGCLTIPILVINFIISIKALKENSKDGIEITCLILEIITAFIIIMSLIAN